MPDGTDWMLMFWSLPLRAIGALIVRPEKSKRVSDGVMPAVRTVMLLEAGLGMMVNDSPMPIVDTPRVMLPVVLLTESLHEVVVLVAMSLTVFTPAVV